MAGQPTQNKFLGYRIRVAAYAEGDVTPARRQSENVVTATEAEAAPFVNSL